MDKWPSGKDYYWKLSQAFQQGQTHLLVEPSPELLQLENPYDLQQRNGIEYLWDTSFYKGKYYLYWGPIPAVIGVLVSSITSKPVTDTGLVFLFVIGIASFSVLLLRDIHRKYKYPAWVFWGGVIASTVNIPLIWLLTRPKFYEVSIVGGQCFLMMGFFALFRAFRSPMLNKGHIVLASLSFGLAGATRINLLPSVIFLAIVIFWRIFVANQKKINFSLPALTAAFLPLALVACFMLWYNYDRFDSIFEFGHRYQLTGSSLPPNYKDTSSANYIIPNLYSYVFRPPSLDREFPFLTVPWVKENMWPYFIHIPEHYYYTEPVAGILFIVPLVGLALLFLARYFWLLVNGDLSVPEIGDGGHENQISWYRFSMLGCFLIQAFILVIFINSAMRYLFDISTLLIVLSVIFMGSYLHTFAQNKFQIRIAALLWILVSMLTVLAGFIIGFTGDENNFLNQNPSLYYQWLERFGG
ncbi:MAG: hypothetical protein ISR59_00330 [Anaerolineales bacterium]|uniref:Uncharacterized protein n=1 Tax=Candidatus Desulfolinea nitratireducens TaxID=2841698 RepID=A0A8J6TIQ0_9CHLR|nr:hypothetical protein [Candidatus Desulfolinea nitratireducens]MBL6959525.1 hypothetical protein [Anaerolineales bacterium]